MASVSSINSNSSGSLAPNPPPRTHSRPNQPPPPPPIPTVPPVPPARDSSIGLTKSVGNSGRNNNITMKSAPNIGINQLRINNTSSSNNNNSKNHINHNEISHHNNNNSNNQKDRPFSSNKSAIIGPVIAIGQSQFLAQFETIFKPIDELPLPDSFIKTRQSNNLSF